MFEYEYKNQNIIIKNVTCFDLKDTLDCGQAFRWKQIQDNTWQGIAHSRVLKISKDSNNIILHSTNIEDFENIWIDYFDLNRDYNSIIKLFMQDPVLKKAIEFSNGIRILNQDPWETLCSFIISQNNNIPRIKGIIERLCVKFGEKIGDDLYSFPSAETIASVSVEDLLEIRCGFRAKYILDAAKKVSTKQINLSELINTDYKTALTQLTTIYGVGEKVANCTLLFGLKHIEAFPVDVWIKKALKTLYNGNLPVNLLDYAGIAQQYIFNYARINKIQ